MKTRLMQGCFVFLCASAFTLVSGCGTKEIDAGPTNPMNGAAAQFLGTVVAPTPSPFIIATDDGEQHSFVIVPETKIKVDGMDATLAAVKQGDSADIQATMVQGQVTVVSMEIKSAASAAQGQ